MHYKLMFPNEFLGAADRREKDVVLTITDVRQEELESKEGKERKPVAYFKETAAAAQRDKTKEKKLVLNKTNAKTIAKLYGSETDGWKGKRITLYPTQTQAFGDTVDCIRIRPTVPAQEKAQ